MHYPVLAEPKNYFKGVGKNQLPTPTDILLFTRTAKEKLQQEALQNRSHHRFVLIFNFETTGHVHVNNRVLDFAPGQALLILPYQFHHFSLVAGYRLHWLFCTFELRDESFLKPLRNRVLEPEKNTCTARDLLFKEWRQAEQYPEQLQTSLIRLLLALKQDGEKSDSSRASEYHDSLLQTINRLMSEWRGKTVVIADLAKKLDLSESRLRTLFRESAGIPLGRYMQNYRLNCAMALLKTTRLSIADVAEDSGFGSPQAFSRVFKKEVGQPPRAYREQC